MLIWVFGATAVGKKHFIAKALTHESFASFAQAWMKDGDDTDKEVASGKDLLIRWQWGREHVLHRTALVSPQTRQKIVVVQANLECHYERGLLREGEEKFNADVLYKEALTVEWLARGLADYWNLPLFTVFTGDDCQEMPRWRIQSRNSEAASLEEIVQ